MGSETAASRRLRLMETDLRIVASLREKGTGTEERSSEFVKWG
jgi:hypothetical protein